MRSSMVLVVTGILVLFWHAFPKQVYGQTKNIQPRPNRMYHVVDLGTLGGDSSYVRGVNAINASGQIVGVSRRSNDPFLTSYVFLHTAGSMIDKGIWSGDGGWGVNARGQIAGSGLGQAFLYFNNSLLYLGTLGGDYSVMNGINDHGEIVGWSSNSSNITHSFLYSGGSMRDLGSLGGDNGVSVANAINNHGHVVGWFGNSLNQAQAFFYSDGLMKDLGTFGGVSSSAEAINDADQIVGSFKNSSRRTRAFLYSNGLMEDLGTLPGDDTGSAVAINNHGDIIGHSFNYNAGSSRAFLYSDGSMKNLADLLIDQNSGWEFKTLSAINDAGQIVGYGKNPSGAFHAFLLNPIPMGWKEAIEAQPSQPTYGGYPTKGAGKDSLVLITHGWINRFLTPLSLSPPDQTWVNGMSNAVQSYLTAHSLNNWQVYGYKWLDSAWKFQAPVALYNARGEGANLGSVVSVQGWSHVHLIGYSAGAELIHEAAQWIKAQGATVQCTFLDAYVGNDKAGADNYGDGVDWSDSYFSHDVTGNTTEQPLDHGYNVDVTQLGPKKGITKFRSQVTGQMEVCTKTIKYHGWSIEFYMNTITGTGVNGDYSGFGFPLSKEGGGWGSGIPSYTVGNVPAQVLGTPDPSCVNDISITPPSYPNTVPDFTQLPTIESTTGTIQKWIESLKLSSGSPVWIGTVVSSTNPVNTVSFNTQFTSTNGAQGLLTIYWDANVIGTIDERISTTNHYSFRFPNAVAGSDHVLGFRLDPFTNIQSVVTLTNIAFNQVGVSQPFSLAVTTSTTNGLPVWELTGQEGFVYGIQASTNLIDWTNIAELVNTNGAVRFYDQEVTNHFARFYRGISPQ